MERICKIVCFDEDSVTDYVQIVAGGDLEKTTELLKSRDTQEGQNLQANGKVGIGGVFNGKEYCKKHYFDGFSQNNRGF